jgi:hypothetical protein
MQWFLVQCDVTLEANGRYSFMYRPAKKKLGNEVFGMMTIMNDSTFASVRNPHMAGISSRIKTHIGLHQVNQERIEAFIQRSNHVQSKQRGIRNSIVNKSSHAHDGFQRFESSIRSAEVPTLNSLLDSYKSEELKGRHPQAFATDYHLLKTELFEKDSLNQLLTQSMRIGDILDTINAFELLLQQQQPVMSQALISDIVSSCINSLLTSLDWRLKKGDDGGAVEVTTEEVLVDTLSGDLDYVSLQNKKPKGSSSESVRVPSCFTVPFNAMMDVVCPGQDHEQELITRIVLSFLNEPFMKEYLAKVAKCPNASFTKCFTREVEYSYANFEKAQTAKVKAGKISLLMVSFVINTRLIIKL